MKRELVTAKEPKAPISEMFKTLRTNIQFMNSKSNRKTMLVTSISPQEGKSWISSNLAVTFAQTGKRVIIIDADMRKGRQNVIFGVQNDRGLSDYLSRGKKDDLVDYIKETEVQNLFLLTAGKFPTNPSELLVSQKTLKMIEQLEEVFDIIIFDGAPTSLVTDSMILARLVDSIIIVAQYNKTKKDQLEKLKKDIQHVGGKIAGVVLNKKKCSKKGIYEKYYYADNVQMVKVKDKSL
ncbi:MAG: CpsD/CapB family tyrosine-protein kinase [Clostridia bacterium]|nr:CpsD/CapB family tyrosine-protein kinase [Clostridia bacterium]